MRRRTSSNSFFDRKGDQVIDRDGRNIMEIAHDEGFMVNGVAERLGISVRDFEVALDEAVGMNPKNFFRQYRAVMARRLIQEGRNLHEIADDLGFRHYSHFSTEMKGFYGIAPLRLKKLVEKRCGTMNPA
jgi:AraC-like DNA-binding protein